MLLIGLAVDTIGDELRDLEEEIPPRKDTSVSGAVKEREEARAALMELALALRDIGISASESRFQDIAALQTRYRSQWLKAVPLLWAAEPWSLFNPSIHDAHFAALRRLYNSASDPSQPQQVIDRD